MKLSESGSRVKSICGSGRVRYDKLGERRDWPGSFWYLHWTLRWAHLWQRGEALSHFFLERMQASQDLARVWTDMINQVNAASQCGGRKVIKVSKLRLWRWEG